MEVAALRLCRIGLCDPVAGIGCDRVGTGAVVVGPEGVGDEIVARQQPPAARSLPKIGVAKDHAGIEIGDYQ